MSWLFGTGIGLFMGGPLGAVVGGVMQHILTKDTREMILSNPAPTNQETVFVTNLAVIMTKVAMADGYVSQEEIQLINNFFYQKLRYQGEELRFIEGIINETQRLNPDLSLVCRAFKLASDIQTRMLLIDITYQIASTDHIITESEQNTINLIVLQLGISEQDHQRIKNQYAQDTQEKKKDYYTILGITSGATPEEIKKAYREAASQYHPDKVSHLGKELIEFANNKFTEIKTAYEEIKKIKGI